MESTRQRNFDEVSAKSERLINYRDIAYTLIIRFVVNV